MRDIHTGRICGAPKWNPDATQVTVALQQVIDSWGENGKYIGTEYELISDEFTISLK